MKARSKPYRRKVKPETFDEWFERILVNEDYDEITQRDDGILATCNDFINGDEVNQILQTENLARDFEKLQKNLKLDLTLPRRNVTVGRPLYKDTINPMQKAILFTKFKSDFDNYNYDW